LSALSTYRSAGQSGMTPVIFMKELKPAGAGFRQESLSKLPIFHLPGSILSRSTAPSEGRVMTASPSA